jgi:hypothetical protein
MKYLCEGLLSKRAHIETMVELRGKCPDAYFIARSNDVRLIG